MSCGRWPTTSGPQVLRIATFTASLRAMRRLTSALSKVVIVIASSAKAHDLHTWKDQRDHPSGVASQHAIDKVRI